MNENFVKNLPSRFVLNTIGLCGAAGEQWLNDLPQTIANLETKWSFKVLKPFPNLSYNFVAPCVFDDGSEAVLKIALPLNNPEIFNEAEFLRISGGDGMVNLLKSDDDRRAILLEKLAPGKNLKELFSRAENRAVETAIDCLRQILKPVPQDSTFHKLENWFDNFFRKAAPTDFPSGYSHKAREIFERLSRAEKFLLHGDLHHENILSAAREPFLAIDPKGIVGNLGYEIAVFLNNHLWWLKGQPDLEEKLRDTVEKFSGAFEISSVDLREWAFAQIVLSAWWTFEENNKNWRGELAFAENWKV